MGREAARFESCEIRRWRGYATSTFYAATAAGEVLAESEPFRWRKSAPPPETRAARAAYDTVVAAVRSDGWTITDEATGAWYETRFRRPACMPPREAAAPPVARTAPVAPLAEPASAPSHREHESPAPPSLAPLPPTPTRIEPGPTRQPRPALAVAGRALALAAPEPPLAPDVAVFEPAPRPVPMPETPSETAKRLAEVEAVLIATRQELDAFRSRIGELERERDDARTLAVEASERAQALEHDLELAKARREGPPGPRETGARLEKPAAMPDTLWRLEELETRVDHHLAFVGNPAGYSLVECSGPPPLVDTIVELPAESGVRGHHRVVRIGKANLPGVDAPCAYLLAVD